jgi:hypothetical protein
VLYRKQQHTNNITEQSRDSGNHQPPPPSPSPSQITFGFELCDIASRERFYITAF